MKFETIEPNKTVRTDVLRITARLKGDFTSLCDLITGLHRLWHRLRKRPCNRNTLARWEHDRPRRINCGPRRCYHYDKRQPQLRLAEFANYFMI